MNAPLASLIRQAEMFREDYGWTSPTLLQRRLRVDQQASIYLNGLVNIGRIPPHWLKEPPPIHR
jgi:hypothetical protein